MTEKTLKDVKQPLIGGRCIAQFEGHFNHFVEPDICYESSIFDVEQFDRHLVIGHRQVETAEHSCSSKHFVTKFRRQ